MRWIFRFFSYWPLSWLRFLGGALGWAVWCTSPRMRQRFRQQVALAGVPWVQARPAIAEAGRFVAELPRLWFQPPHKSALKNVRIEGIAHAQAAFVQGRGVIFIGPHCGSFELGPQALAEIFGPAQGPILAIYRPARQTLLARLEVHARQRPYLDVTPASLGSIRKLHRALQANRAVAMLCDQVPPEGQGIWAPFFGKPAYTMTLAVRLAWQTGAVVLPVGCERLGQGVGYRLVIWPALALAPAPAASAGNAAMEAALGSAVTRMNLALEAIIRSQPGQYLWAYARHKQPRREA